MSLSVGKSKVDVRARGCVGCGTQWSSGWSVARRLSVLIEKRRFTLDIWRCSDCNRKESVGMDGKGPAAEGWLFDLGARNDGGGHEGD